MLAQRRMSWSAMIRSSSSRLASMPSAAESFKAPGERKAAGRIGAIAELQQCQRLQSVKQHRSPLPRPPPAAA